MIQKSKIIATLGPSSSDEIIIEKLIQAGMDVARLNFSHGKHDDHLEKIKLLRKLSKKLDQPITILQDLQGPKLRVGLLPSQGIQLISGKTIILRRLWDNQFKGSSNKSEPVIPLDIPDVTSDLHPGGRILMDDGNLQLRIIEVKADELIAEVEIGGTLFSHKGVNLPGSALRIPGFTIKDQEDLKFGLAQGVDAIAVSFVRSAEDIKTVRQTVQEYLPEDKYFPIIAKLELPEAILNLDEIMDAADGVMVARGDLAVETTPSSVPITQKEIIHAANLKAKLVITATQMLESMVKNLRPTRAEASDVANAILDGTDAVMLSAETASGAYPVESVAMMDSIIQETESHFEEWGHLFIPELKGRMDDAMALAFAARELAHDREVRCIAVFTQTGRSALYLSKMRPDVPILAFTPFQKTYQRLGLFWGVIPNIVPFSSSLEEMIAHVEQAIVSSTILQPGQKVVIISGFPINANRPANLALLHTIGEKH
jgi:pyruvate kinase